MKNTLIKISVGFLALCLFASCTLIGGGKPRPFRERSFDAAAWRAGDAQTRGEMSRDLQWRKDTEDRYLLNRRSRRQIRELLGEPDRKTRGRCCGAGGTSDEEVWLYELEVMVGTSLKTEHFQIYFHSSDTTDEWRIAEWDDAQPDFFPRVG